MIQEKLTSPTAAPGVVPSVKPSHDPCVFILGCDRSGTSLFQKLLAAHSQLHIAFEAAIPLRIRHLYATRDVEAVIRALIDDFSEFKNIDVDGLHHDVQMLERVEFPDIAALMYRRLATLHGKHRWGDKSPDYAENIPSLALMFPEARYIHLVRDPRAVASSLVRHNWGPSTYWQAARMWAYKVEMATIDMQILGPHRGLTIRFEDVVGDPETTLRGVCQFLDLDWESGMIDAKTREKITSGSKSMNVLHRKSNMAIDAQRAESWRGISPRRLQHIEAVCRHLMPLYQYDCIFENPVPPTGPEVFGYKLYNRLVSIRKLMRQRIDGMIPPKYVVR
jgi:hypothetical protein